VTTTDAAAYLEPAPRPQLSRAVRATVELLDQRFRVFGFRFGMDAVIGLVPVVGDLVGMLVGYGLVLEAVRLRASWRTIGRMIVNLWMDGLVGAVPIVGDLFDFFFQANRRNLALLERDLARA
jgi:hypothetical protein